MMEAAGVTGVQYNHFWVELEETTSGITLPLAAVLVLLLSGAFSREYDTGMYRILTATPMGKRRSMFCKVGISLLLGVGTALLALLLPAAVYLGLGTPEGWNSPLSQLGEGWFTYTPYDLQMWQYFLYKLLFVCLGMAGGGTDGLLFLLADPVSAVRLHGVPAAAVHRLRGAVCDGHRYRVLVV